MSEAHRPTLALTLGDPSGIGGELAAKLLASGEPQRLADILVIASREELDRAAGQAGVELDVADAPDDSRPGRAVLRDPGRPGPLPTVTGRVDVECGAWTKAALEFAVRLAEAGEIDGICFMPLNKAALHEAGMHAEDELRWFADLMKYTGPTSEINVLPQLWTSRITSHIPMADVADRITAARVTEIVVMFEEMLRDSGIAAPRVGVAALNPHNGENGIFGRHEIDEIAPGVAAARAKGIDVQGPFSADTIFLKGRDGVFDGIVTMYHDQGQIAMKLLGFDGGVTIQGGLPVPVTTPAHGTAFEIVGKGVADTNSASNAFEIAATIASRRLARA
ncbi:4-hydroxythreonine-4-phosphate dehydrogenase PdxA [Streptomyces kunmingensis]|uniref:4-hydroxythreonine-4-phosphate dehydrogenase PdxA n=1 Tax=Streptomyces kunmingensis TaxID=68225 RepID=A0ABU6C6K4_9ACTN|nr:4-hydroxythreonine-4-phosphate dehydrogenase PdxA [Streptomyces kunmingensis]MEB3960223.1 4-hydroxythreonine-4-phosphate dehydrogenase PdxA [Streptomyces kunmingensis]